MSDLHPETVAPATIPQGHEQTDATVRPLSIFLATLATSLVIVCAIVAGLFQLLLHKAKQVEPSTTPLAESKSTVVPGPRLQVSARDDIETFRVREDKKIRTLEWVDREQKVARIPIERAIEITAQRGLPKWPEVPVANPDPEKSPSKDEQSSPGDERAQTKADSTKPNEPAANEGSNSQGKEDALKSSSGEPPP